ncbi:exonuclease domain-containing protein [Streptomyces sp. NPDC058155]|uniref:exonuclease domain-containing protein n=1 Tax=Streptomyces sp. NPDC058155 TaxID=3346359 RepID=UPI0036E0A873
MWHTSRLCAFDLETTGVDVEADRIVTAAVIGLGGGVERESSEWLANPGIEIPAEAYDVHKISTEYAREHGDPAEQVIGEIAAGLAEQIVAYEAALVGHNVPFDLTMLDRECRRYKLPTLHERLDGVPLLVLDTRVLDQHCLPYRPRPSEEQGARQLVTLAAVYELPWDNSEAHGCAYDALMAARILHRIGTLAHMRPSDWPERIRHHRRPRFWDLKNRTVAELHARQIVWAAEQAAGLQAHFRKTDPAAVVDGSWPLTPWGEACVSA